MASNQITKIKCLKNKYILYINNKEYPIDSYFYECILPYDNKILDTKTMLDVIAFSSANPYMNRLYKKIFNHAISTYDFKVYLSNKKINEDYINLIVSFLKNEGLFKEIDFINHYKEIYQNKKGIKAFKRFLVSKHISEKAIEKSLYDYKENYDYALEYANKYIKSKVSSNAMLKQKLLANLLNKGFSKDTIDYVLENIEYKNEDESLIKEIQKYKKLYPDNEYKIISKLASKGYNINRIKKLIMEEGMSIEN